MSKAATQREMQLSSNTQAGEDAISPLSNELVIAFVGYAGAGCSTVAKYMLQQLSKKGYEAKYLRLSRLIADVADGPIPEVDEAGTTSGQQKLSRAAKLQDVGDRLRGKYGDSAIASLAVGSIRKERGERKAGETKLAFILDSIKHPAEIELLRRVYDRSFRLVAVHADQRVRLDRLFGEAGTFSKFSGASKPNVERFLSRDEEDAGNDRGQHVRDAFYLADYFIDNNVDKPLSMVSTHFAPEVERFLNLMLGEDLVRPTSKEKGMYFAHVASLQSACLSRQVGAAIQSEDGRIISTGTNEVPKFKGGVYGDDDEHDHRCVTFEFDPRNGDPVYVGCHNSRKKKEIREGIISALAEVATAAAVKAASTEKAPLSETLAAELKVKVAEALRTDASTKSIPFIKDLIEFSRSVHAEMNAIINAGRNGCSTDGLILFTTTYPCHNCARHILAAGIREVYFIEPYVKSLTLELHSDAVTSMPNEKGTKMLIVPFTGVGPRMYEDYFRKNQDLKDSSTGKYLPSKQRHHFLGVRILDIDLVEERAAKLVQLPQ